jgi:hypothetical protein
MTRSATSETASRVDQIGDEVTAKQTRQWGLLDLMPPHCHLGGDTHKEDPSGERFSLAASISQTSPETEAACLLHSAIQKSVNLGPPSSGPVDSISAEASVQEAF